MLEEYHKIQFLHTATAIGCTYCPLRTTTDEMGQELLRKEKMMGGDAAKSIAPSSDVTLPTIHSPLVVTLLLDCHQTSLTKVPDVFCPKSILHIDSD